MQGCHAPESDAECGTEGRARLSAGPEHETPAQRGRGFFLWVWADPRGLCISLYQEALYDNAVSYNRPLA